MPGRGIVCACGWFTWATIRLRMTLVEVEASGVWREPLCGPLEVPEGAGLGPPLLLLNCFSERSVTGRLVLREGGVGGGLAANRARI